MPWAVGAEAVAVSGVGQCGGVEREEVMPVRASQKGEEARTTSQEHTKAACCVTTNARRLCYRSVAEIAALLEGPQSQTKAHPVLSQMRRQPSCACWTAKVLCDTFGEGLMSTETARIELKESIRARRFMAVRGVGVSPNCRFHPRCGALHSSRFYRKKTNAYGDKCTSGVEESPSR